MKARDVLARGVCGTHMHPRHVTDDRVRMYGEDGVILQDALLAQTPEGEGVYIAPDGTLMRVQPTTIYERGNGPLLYRLVPIGEATE